MLIPDLDIYRSANVLVTHHGTDAPESQQLCRLDGKPWQCGKDATNALANKIARRPVTCEDLGRDLYKRIIGRCTAAGEDMGAWMVQQGLAGVSRYCAGV